MSTSTHPDLPDLRATHLWFERGRLVVQLLDGRELACPLAFFPRLAGASAKDLADWRFTGRGTGIHWPSLDEDLSVQGLLEGRRAPEADVRAKALAPRLCAARRSAGLTQAQLAERMGRSQTLVSLAERGALRIGTPYLRAVLDACGLPVDWEP
jgi:DNA-binding XRE family transcriptional regulator